MQLAIDFYINPALLDNETSQYIARREILLDPDDAVAGIRSWGNIEQQLLGEFRKQYGDLPFKEIKPSGMVLLPAWDNKFDIYVTGWFEVKYQEYKMKQFRANAQRDLAARKAELEEKVVWLEYLLKKEMESTDYLIISPSTAVIKIDESVTFTVTAVSYAGQSKDVTANALPDNVFISVIPGSYPVRARYDGKEAVAQVTVEDILPPPVPDDPDVSQLLAHADCSGYPNTIPIWDDELKDVYCDCLPGYSWMPDYSGCEETGKLLASQADCSGYPNTQPVWDDVNQIVICDCLPGYVWDQNFTQCYSQALAQLNVLECSGLSNTMAMWDPVRNEPYCDCVPGYQWRDDFSGCDAITATQIVHADCSHIPNSQQVYDPVSDIMVCDCLPGFTCNAGFTACVPERKKPAIDMNTLMDFMMIISGSGNPFLPQNQSAGNNPANQQSIIHQSRCNDTQKAGANQPEVHQIDLGQISGSFQFDYQTFDVKDQIIITQGGMTIFNSGCIGETRSVRVPFSGYTSVIEVRVNPNCAGSSSTAWNFKVHCPAY